MLTSSKRRIGLEVFFTLLSYLRYDLNCSIKIFIKMNNILKHGLFLAIIGISMGVLAGILVVTVDLSFVKTYFWLIVAVLLAINIGLIALAFKKGRIP